MGRNGSGVGRGGAGEKPSEGCAPAASVPQAGELFIIEQTANTLTFFNLERSCIFTYYFTNNRDLNYCPDPLLRMNPQMTESATRASSSDLASDGDPLPSQHPGLVSRSEFVA